MKRSLLILCGLVATALVKAQNPYPIVKIDTIQFVNDQKLALTPPNDSPDYVSPVKKNPVFGDTVRYEGIVLMDPAAYGLSRSRRATYIQRKGGGPWSGVQVMCDPGSGPTAYKHPNNTAYTLAELNTESQFFQNMVKGYPVRVTGVIRSFQGENQVNILPSLNPNFSNAVEQLSLSLDTIVSTTITIDSVMTGNVNTGRVQQKARGEKWEGVYVELKNVTVYSVQGPSSSNRYTWSLSDDNGNQIFVRDFSGYFRNDGLEDTSIVHLPHTFAPPIIGSKLDYFKGVITEFSPSSGAPQEYGIAPLYPSDIGVSSYNKPIVNSLSKTPALVTATDSVIISAKTTKGSTQIANMKLYYAVGYSTTTFDSVQMIRNTLPNDTNVWYAKIPNQAAGSIVKYWVKAIDANNFNTDFPNNQGLNSAYMVVNGPNVTIAQLQFSPYANYATIFNGDSLTGINLRGVVTGNAFSSSSQNLLTIQDGTGPNSAILIQRGAGDPTSSWKVGDSVMITSGKVTETFTTTILYNIRGSVISSGNPLPPFATNLPLDSFVTNNVHYARPWEAVLVRFDSVYVTNVNPDAPSNNGEFSIHKDKTKTGLRVDDMNSELRNLNNKIKKDMYVPFIQGPMWFSFGNFKMIPRGKMDIDLSRLDTLAPVLHLKGKAQDTIEVHTAYVDSGATAIDNIDGDITASIVKTGTVDTSKAGNNIIKYKVTDNWGNSDSVTRMVYVKEKPVTPGVRENEMAAANISVYPSPADNQITVTANGIQSLPVQITVVDILGRELMGKQLKQGTFSESLNISSLNNGVYFCVIRNDKGSRTIRFVVSK